MSLESTISFSKTGPSLFTPEEVRQLMRVEFDRAQRYGYPIACMMLQVDRLENLHTVHGYDAKEQVLVSAVELVKRETRASDFLGCRVDDRLLAIIPHTHPDAANFLAQRLLKGARAISFDANGRLLRLTLSIGMSHNQHPGTLSFETLIRVAEEGLCVADAGGGDRVVETELYQFYEAQLGRAEPSLAATQIQPIPEEFDELDYKAKLMALVGETGSLEEAASKLADEIVGRAMREVEGMRERAPAHNGLNSELERGYQQEIDILERRVAKLTQSLGVTEGELNRVRLHKGADDGIASIYREVQGLQTEDAQSKVKQELMSCIFQANLDLQRQPKSA